MSAIVRMRGSTREAEVEDVEGRRLFGWVGFSVPLCQRQISGSPKIESRSMWMDEFCSIRLEGGWFQVHGLPITGGWFKTGCGARPKGPLGPAISDITTHITSHECIYPHVIRFRPPMSVCTRKGCEYMDLSMTATMQPPAILRAGCRVLAL